MSKVTHFTNDQLVEIRKQADANRRRYEARVASVHARRATREKLQMHDMRRRIKEIM